jgi:hypothetical protein
MKNKHTQEETIDIDDILGIVFILFLIASFIHNL